MKKGLFLLPLLVLGLVACGSNPSASLPDSTTESGGETSTSTPAPAGLIATYDFTVLTGTGQTSDELTNPQDVLGSLGTAITWTSGTKVYNGNGTGGVRESNPAGLLKFGSSKAQGVLSFTVNENVSRIVLGCHSFYGVSDSYPTNTTNFVKVNDMTPVVAPYNATGASEDVEFNLSPATNSITITSCNEDGTGAGRIILYTISLYR